MPQADELPNPFPGEYRLLRKLGEGSFGTVWLADDLNLDRQVALKTLRLPSHVADTETALSCLRNEAQILAKVRHPNIVQVHAWRQAGGEHYLVLQYVSGGSLRERLDQVGALPWHLAGRYMADVADALEEVHRGGIIHRDIKPHNILLDTEADEAVLTDFGVSVRLMDVSLPAGSPAYMAPEAFQGEVSPALDVYALAATLFHLITGALPFVADNRAERIEAIAAGLPEPDARCRSMPAAIERVIRSGLKAHGQTRPTLAAFGGQLRAALNQSLVDTMTLSGKAPVGKVEGPVRLRVSRQRPGGGYETVAATPGIQEHFLRDLKRVPPAPDQISLRTGERVRIEAWATVTGYLTVFNVGPAGKLNLLAPNADEPPLKIQADRPLTVLEAELTPPPGKERLFAVWSQAPLPLRPENLLNLAADKSVSPAYRATRDLKRVQQSVADLQPGSCATTVLELDHQS